MPVARRRGLSAVWNHKALVLALVGVAATLVSAPIDNAWQVAIVARRGGRSVRSGLQKAGCVLAALEDGSVQRSADNGATWSVVATF